MENQIKMMKTVILTQLVSDRLLKDKIYNELHITQETIGQSFRRCLKNGKPSGESHSKKVINIIKTHLKISNFELYDN
jgi:hypothetical protein